MLRCYSNLNYLQTTTLLFSSCCACAGEAHGPTRLLKMASPSSSDESSLLSPPAQRTGRPRMSYVWDYFSYDQDTGRSTCTVLIGDDSGKRQCGTQFVGKYPTNLKNHHKKSHPTEFKEMEKKELARKEATAAREGKPIQVHRQLRNRSE